MVNGKLERENFKKLSCKGGKRGNFSKEVCGKETVLKGKKKAFQSI